MFSAQHGGTLFRPWHRIFHINTLRMVVMSAIVQNTHKNPLGDYPSRISFLKYSSKLSSMFFLPWWMSIWVILFDICFLRFKPQWSIADRRTLLPFQILAHRLSIPSDTHACRQIGPWSTSLRFVHCFWQSALPDTISTIYKTWGGGERPINTTLTIFVTSSGAVHTPVHLAVKKC